MNKSIKVIILISGLILSIKGALIFLDNEVIESPVKTVLADVKTEPSLKNESVKSLKLSEASEPLPLAGNATDEIGHWAQDKFGYFYAEQRC